MTRAILRPSILAAALAVSGLPAGAFDIRAMTPEESAAFGEAVRGYLMQNPGVLMEVIGELEAQQAEAQAAGEAELVAANRAAIFEDGHSWVGGNPEGSVTLVEFIDYRCGYCRKAHAEVADLVQSDGDIRYVVKEFPILGEDSVLAARFAVAALRVAGAEAYKALHDGFYTGFRGEVTEANLIRFAEELDLDGTAIAAAMDSPEVERVLAENHALADRLQIQGTPTFVLGDQLVRGYLPEEQMRAIVAEVRG
ncbi:DsbA family protein [Frigidibacter oleivorans]|uniref:DsbA family protein n=1 Tax=Frigidibacter oleivorans TaxID=2487129 RepID=UPI000F8F25DE|nr:DsbA family protein [Frigidibacter oleivorans]